MINQLSIIQEATRRSLANGSLSSNRQLNVPQQEALLNYYTFLSEAPAHDRINKYLAYFDMATGTGKTGLFSVIAHHAHRIASERGYGDDFKTIIVEPTTLLLRQTQDELIAASPGLKDSIGIYGDGSKELQKPVTIMTYHAWSELAEGGHLGNIDFEIKDESHNTLSERRQSATRSFIGNTVHMGLTASAQYDNQKTMEITHQNLIYKIGLRNAIERGFLTDYAHIQFVFMRILPSLTENHKGNLEKGQAPYLKQTEWSKLAVMAYATMFDEISGQPLSDKIGNFFAANTRHADDLAYMLNTHPVLQKRAKEQGFQDVAISVHSVGQTPREQEKRLEAFKAGAYMAITGDRKIQAGFDHPPVKFAATYPGNSLVDIVQEVGRSTRRWIDPKTGEAQGTVILEAIPYIGYADPEEDRKSQTLALANTTTAYEILKSPAIYSPTRHVKIADKPVIPVSRKPIILSHNVTAEIFTTVEDTLFVGRMIDEAQTELRVAITAQMLAELKEKIVARGNYSGLRLMRAVEDYERKTNQGSTGMFHYDITQMLYGSVKTMQVKKWQRLKDAIDDMPLIQLADRIDVTSTMLGKIRDKISEKGGFSYVLLMREIEKFESERQLTSTGITEPQISRIIMGNIKTIESGRWARFNDVLDTMPSLEVAERIEITPLMLSTFKEKTVAIGSMGAVRLMKEIEKYEALRELPASGLTNQILGRIYLGSIKTIEKARWQRLNEVIDSLPVIALKDRVEITAAMLAELKAKIIRIGSLGSRRLVVAVERYEMANGIPTAGVSAHQIDTILSGPVKSMQHDRWQRLNDVLDQMPSITERVRVPIEERFIGTRDEVAEHRLRIPFTSVSLTELKQKIFERGNFGARQLMTEVGRYEKEKLLLSAGLTYPIIQTIIIGALQTVDMLQWERLNEVVDSLPLKILQSRMEITQEMTEEFRRKVAAKGSFGGNRLVIETRKIEQAFKLPSVDVSSELVAKLLAGTYKTVAVEQWDRINAVLDILPTIGDRVKITEEMRESLLKIINDKGSLGASRLVKIVHKFETENYPQELSNLTAGIIGSIAFEGTVKTILRLQWNRLHEALEALPSVASESRIDVSEELYVDLLSRVDARGRIGHKRLIRAIEKYEDDQELSSTGLSQQILHHLLGGRAKSIEKRQWDRLNAVIDNLPLQEIRKRLNLTRALLDQLSEEIEATGGYGPRLLYLTVKEFERKNDLPDIGISEPIICTIIYGELDTVDESQWNRLNDAVTDLPIQERVEKVDITPEMLDGLHRRMQLKGNVGYKALIDNLKKFESEKKLPQTRLTAERIMRVAQRKQITLDKMEWDRLNELLDSLPDATARTMIPVTSEMLAGLRQKRAERGNYGAVVLFNLSERGDSLIKLSVNYIARMIFEGSKIVTTDAGQWKRLNEVLDELLEISPSTDAGADSRVGILRRSKGGGRKRSLVP